LSSDLTLLSCDLMTVTGCLKIEAVCLMGAISEASDRMVLKMFETNVGHYGRSVVNKKLLQEAKVSEMKSV
jgi:hypothetical protein